MKSLQRHVVCWSILAFCFLSSPPSIAQGGGGTAGGGTTIVEDYKRILRDLSRRTCSIRSTQTMLKEQNLALEYDRILSSLYRVHPYMAYRIRSEADRIQWCYTGNLKRVITDDKDSITVNYVQQFQAAIRDIDGKKVYLDLKELQKIPADQRAMTFIHETMHSFFPVPFPNRNEMLRTATKAIYENFQAQKYPEDVDSMLTFTGLIQSFKTVEQARALVNFVLQPTEATARELMRHRQGDFYDPKHGLFYEIVNDFKRPSLLASAEFREVLERLEVSSSLIPQPFHFSLFHNQIWWELTNFKSKDSKFLFGVTPPLNSVPFGTCRIDGGGAYFVKNSKMFSWEVNASLSVTFTPGEGWAKNQAYRFAYDFKTTYFRKNVSNIEDAQKKLDQLHHRELDTLLQKLRGGLCDDPNAKIYQYLH